MGAASLISGRMPQLRNSPSDIPVTWLSPPLPQTRQSLDPYGGGRGNPNPSGTTSFITCLTRYPSTLDGIRNATRSASGGYSANNTFGFTIDNTQGATSKPRGALVLPEPNRQLLSRGTFSNILPRPRGIGTAKLLEKRPRLTCSVGYPRRSSGGQTITTHISSSLVSRDTLLHTFFSRMALMAMKPVVSWGEKPVRVSMDASSSE